MKRKLDPDNLSPAEREALDRRIAQPFPAPESVAAEKSSGAAALSDRFDRIESQLAELRELLFERNARAGDLVTASYIHRRTGLSERTILEGKAGTSAIPRVNLGPKIVRFPKGAVDKFIDEKTRAAREATPKARALRLLRPKRRRA